MLESSKPAGASLIPGLGQTQARILLIEDDEDTRTLLSSTLTDEGFQVFEASDGNKALAHLQEHLPDLVLLDLMMPDLDGFEVCTRIRANPRTKSLPVLILTAKDEFSEKMKGFKAGGDDYITKPFILSEVIARIKVHLRIQELQKHLAFSEKRYRLLVENSPDVILSLSTSGEILYHNARIREIVKLPPNETLLGKKLEQFFPLSHLFREIDALINKLSLPKGPVTHTTQLSESNRGTLFLEIVGMPLSNAEARMESFLVVIRDITQRQKMEEALIQAEKINSLGILTSGIAHEVNNPLTGISNAIHLLKSVNLAPSRKDEICNHILDGVNRIVKIVKDLRIFSRTPGVSSQVFSVKDAVSETLSLVQYQNKDGKIDIEYLPCEESLTLFGDKNHFQQVILNLLVNAIQAIEGAGKITLRLHRKGKEGLIEVEDTGCGIPQDQLAQIFNPFFTTKRDWKGTGLGLAVSYRIIQLFRGTISVKTAVGKGSRFTITLPLHSMEKEKKPI